MKKSTFMIFFLILISFAQAEAIDHHSLKRRNCPSNEGPVGPAGATGGYSSATISASLEEFNEVEFPADNTFYPVSFPTLNFPPNDINHPTDTQFTVNQAGFYLINYSVDIFVYDYYDFGSGALIPVQMRLYDINSITNIPPSPQLTFITSTQDYYGYVTTASGQTVVYLTPSSTVELQIKNQSSDDLPITIFGANLSMILL